ncbi:glycosyltransferase family 2 protein [[Clostridium] symbiosum]|uniref:glycosyltransferase family 2 protein n=1 Tax=Clostridium symbiosum TaxID=1512 RepID=UPI001D08608C|nr:glycosyltransferase family 2 protein [[Clostridium] symbiosum]MCB6607718.1 glycosyltransferase [[Clostridium] symbiosum]MCB6932579.1 glycosyltransferase [[Clostridium] symbiosum]
MDTLISVIVPVYGVENYLSTCIDSIIKQTYANIEIILVDDGSQDKSGELCDYYLTQDSRIRVIHKKNGGLSDARNAGIDICNGEFISFIDSDDYISPIFIEILYNAAKKMNADIVTCSNAVSFIDGVAKKVELETKLERCNIEEIKQKEVIRKILYQRIPNGAPHRLYKRSIFNELRFPFGYLFEDVATVYKAFFLANKIAIVDANLYAYRIRQDSIVRMKFSDKKMIAITIGKELFENISLFDLSLKKAAASRAFALNFQVFLQVPPNDQENLKKLWEEIIKYRKLVISDFDTYIRPKNKYAAILSFLGMRTAHKIGRRILYNN